MPRQIARLCGLVWLLCLAYAGLTWLRSDIALVDMPTFLQAELARFGQFEAIAIYLMLGALRPLLLFPATIYVVAAGLLFSPPLAATLAITGVNMSGWVGYGVASWWVPDHGKAQVLLNSWATYLREKALPAVFAMRLAGLPFDLVSFACGAARVSLIPFLVGTLFGSLPSLLIIALVVGAVNNPAYRYALPAAAFFVVIVMIISLRRARRHQNDE